MLVALLSPITTGASTCALRVGELALDGLLAVFLRIGFGPMDTVGSLNELPVPPDRPLELTGLAL
jgi:hypothetical protein